MIRKFKFFEITLTIFFITTSSCSKSGGGSGSSITGLDFSGTYMSSSVQCTDSSLATTTHATTYSGVNTGTLTVSGNSYTGTSTVGSCSINYSGSISITDAGMSLSGRTVTSATGGACTQSSVLNGTSITPVTINTAYSTNQTLSNITNVPYIWNATTKLLGLLSIYTDGGGGYCFVVLQKQ